MNDNELFKYMANRYIEHEANLLKQELGAADSEMFINQGSLKRIDKRVRKSVYKRRTDTVIKVLATIAACILVFITVRAILPFVDNSTAEPNSTNSAQFPDTFELPTNLSVSYTKEDNGQKIFFLENVYHDDVVMVLQKGSGADKKELSKVEINGRTAYIKKTGDYNFMTFDIDGINYSLTCKYDINTLIDIGKVML